jgi:hypothetical protein
MADFLLPNPEKDEPTLSYCTTMDENPDQVHSIPVKSEII